MPIGFLTAADRTRLNGFPEQIPHEDLSAFFLLSEADHRAINQHREAHTRLGFALQLCALRYLGFAPDDLQRAPSVAVEYVAQQLGVAPQALAAYGARRPTRTTDFQQVQTHLHFRLATPLDFYALQTWLGERALEHDKPTLLLQLACDKLRREHIVRPGLTRLERLIATARQQAHDETWRRLTPLVTADQHPWLDGLLQPDAQTGRTLLNWLRREATAHTATQIVETLQKVAFLLEAQVDTWDLAGLNPNRVKWLAQLGWKAPTPQLQRMDPRRRYPILLAFLQQALLHHTDVAVELYDQCVWEYHSAAQKELKELRQTLARSTNEKLRLFRELGQVLLDATIGDVAVRAVSFARVPEAVLRAAVEETAGLIRPRHDDAIDFFATRYSTIRQFAPAFLQTLTLHAHGPEDTVLPAVEVIRTLDRAPTRRPVPRDAPMGLVTDTWRPYMREPDGSISRRYYELCTLWHLRSALRAGNIWVAHSRRYANPDTYLIPPAEWPRWRPEVIKQTGTPSDGAARLTERDAELDSTMAQVEHFLARKDSHVRIEDNQIVLSPLEADPRPATAEALAQHITERLPRVALSELLMEVDTWTHFSRHLLHAADAEMPRPTHFSPLYASLVAHACNFGLDQMAHLSDLAYDHLAWCTTWYLREDTLKAAFTALVNYHHTLPLSQAWGSGTLSSSDGQRFPVSGKNRHARRMPPPLGYGMGLTFYSWTSDQLSQYGTKFVPVTVRDATYVLDELCNNETELPIREHTTDTAGATEIIFALFDLLGFRFAPRLRDLHDRRLFVSGAIDMQRYPRLQPHLPGRINRPRILDWWDEMVRAAGSIKLGWVTASLLVQKLQAYPQQNALARALQEYGRLARTLHILRWYAYPEERRRFLRQLNKGEALHDLRAFLMVANKGQLHQSRGEALAQQALCLNLVTNAVIVGNTVYMAAVVEQLKREGYPVQESDLTHVWPTRYAHINVYGKYHFNVEEAHARKGLRPLRSPGRQG
jgi:TnpA family transposase